MMHYFDEYQQLIGKTAIYPNRGSNLVYPVLGICGEAGEVAEKVKKLLRDGGGEMTDEARAAIVKELGDVLWYVVAASQELGVDMSEVVQSNKEKILGRRERGTLRGSGDDR